MTGNTTPLQFTEMQIEYAFRATMGKHGVGYFNCLLQITPDCDCVPWSDAPIVPDVGLLASTDPVAIDAASLELVNQQQGLRGTRLANNLQPGQDKFKGVWGETQGTIQITYGEEIALGTSSYDLVELWHTRLQDKTPPLSQPHAPALPYQASQNGADIPSCG